MSTDTTPAPIVVSSTPTNDQLASAFRAAVLGLSAAATTLGLTHASTILGEIATYAGPVGIIIGLVMSQIHARHDHAKKVTMAAAAPNSVAIIK